MRSLAACNIFLQREQKLLADPVMPKIFGFLFLLVAINISMRTMTMTQALSTLVFPDKISDFCSCAHGHGYRNEKRMIKIYVVEKQLLLEGLT